MKSLQRRPKLQRSMFIKKIQILKRKIRKPHLRKSQREKNPLLGNKLEYLQKLWTETNSSCASICCSFWKKTRKNRIKRNKRRILRKLTMFFLPIERKKYAPISVKRLWKGSWNNAKTLLFNPFSSLQIKRQKYKKDLTKTDSTRFLFLELLKDRKK